MAESKTRWLSNKVVHVWSEQREGLMKWGKIGLVAGAVVGVASVLLAPAAITLGGLALSCAVGAAVWGATGAIMGGFLGAVRGLLTRPEPNVDQIMKDAAECAPTQQVEHVKGHGKAFGVVPGMAGFTPSDETAVLPQQPAPQPQAAPAGGVAQQMTPQRLAEIRQLTEALGDLQGRIGDAAAAQTAQPAPQAESWQSKVASQGAPLGAAETRGR